jgi:hypothetical protein
MNASSMPDRHRLVHPGPGLPRPDIARDQDDEPNGARETGSAGHTPSAAEMGKLRLAAALSAAIDGASVFLARGKPFRGRVI